MAWAPLALGNIDKSDLNGDGVVDATDLELFSNIYFGQSYETVDWCAFYESSVNNPKSFRKLTSDRIDYYTALFNYIVSAYGCEIVQSAALKSDMNKDGVVDELDLELFSGKYLERNWGAVDWCLFYEVTLAGDDFEGIKTGYFLMHFQELLTFINEFFACNAPEPPPNPVMLENTPRAPYRVAEAADSSGDIFASDPKVGSVFIYDPDLVAKGEIKGLNKPLAIAFDLQGRLLVGNSGRRNIEVFDPANGELLAVFGEGVVSMPNAITVDDLGDIYVTDSRRHVVWVFTQSYQLVGWIGNPGEGPEDLNFPIDAEVHMPTQEVFVADQGNNRVQVYDLQGNWLRSINWAGSGCSWFSGTCAVPKFMGLQALEIDSLGRLHVLDRFGGAVITFDAVTGAQLGVYGSYGTEPGQLKLPTDVLATQYGSSIVPSGNGTRIESFTTP
jgi:hypothetical protein